MPEFDEFGIPIRKSDSSSIQFDEFGIPIKRVVEPLIKGPSKPSGLPTFAEQQEQLSEYQKGKYEKALDSDRKKNQRLIADVYDSMIKNTPIVPGAAGGKYIAAMLDQFTSALEPIEYIADEAFITAKNLLTGKVLSAEEKAVERAVIKAQREAGLVPRLAPPKITDSEYRERIASNMDLTDGIGAEDLKALGLVGSRVAGDLAVAVAGQAAGIPMGATYFTQAYGDGLKDWDENVSRKELPSNEIARQSYATAVGVVNSYLEKYGFDKIFGTGPAFKNIQKKVVADLLNNTLKTEGKVAVDVLEKSADDIIKNYVKKFDVLKKVGSASAIEFTTEGAQSALESASRLLANKVQGQEVFNEDEIKNNFWKNVGNEAIAGGIFGGGMGAVSMISPQINNTIISDIASAKTDEDINKIAAELDDTLTKNNVSDSQKELILNNMKRYRDIKQTIPQDISDDKKSEIISLIDRRYQLDNQISQSRQLTENVDEALKVDKEADLQSLIDGRSLINDEIKEISTGNKFRYFGDKGKYFKQFQQESPEEISETYYNLSNLKQQLYATPTSEGQVQEGVATGDIGKRQGTQEGRPQEETPETDIGYRYIVSEEGDEVPVAALVNKKVRINGEPAILYQEGERIVARVLGTNRILDTFGSVTEMSDAAPSKFGIEVDDTLVTETPTGYRVEGAELNNTNENPLDAISYDQNGNVMNVVLTTTAGKRRKFRGQAAQDLAYQITLKETLKNEEEFEQFLQQEHEQELENARLQAATQEQAAPTVEPVPATPTVTVEPAYGRITEGRPIEPVGGGRLRRKVVQDAYRVVRSISDVVKGSTGNSPVVNLHNQNTFEKAVIEAGGTQEDSLSRGFYMSSDGTIHINLDNVASDTALHEGFHPILDFLEANNPEVINDLFSQLEGIKESAPIIEKAKRLYEGDVTQKKEAITDFVASVADGRIVLNPSNFQKIKAFILDMLKKLGIGEGAPMLMDVNTQEDLVNLADFITENFREGRVITYENLADFTEVKPTKENPIAKSGQLQFERTIYSNSGIEKAPALDKKQFQEDVKSGRVSVVNPYESLKDKFFAITFPDDFFTGQIKTDGEVIAYGNGGVFFAAKHGGKGDLWAAAGENSANNFVIQANESLRKNNGEGIIVLSKGDDIKHSTSLEANIAFINTVIKYADKKGQLEPVVRAIKTTYSVGRAKSAETIIDSFNQYLRDGRSESGQRMVDAKVAFDTMASALIKEAGPFMTQMLRDMGFEGDVYFNKTKLKKGEYLATVQGLKAMYIDMLQEDFLKGVNNGAVYAALKFTSPVKYEKDVYHPSYPFVIRTVDGSPIKLEVFTKTFNSYGKEGVAIYGKDRNNENAFGVTTTTKPDYKLNPAFEDNSSQKNLGEQLNKYDAISARQRAKDVVTSKFKPVSEKTIEQDRALQFQKKEVPKNIKESVVRGVKNQFRYGVLGKKNIELLEKREGEVGAELAKAESSVIRALSLMDKYKTSVTISDVRKFLTGKTTANKFPDDLALVLAEMRGHIDGLTDRLIQLGVVNTKFKADAISWTLKDGRYSINAKEITPADKTEEDAEEKVEDIFQYDDMDAEKLIEVIGEEKANIILGQEGDSGELREKDLVIDFYKANKGSYMLRSYSSLNFQDNTLLKNLYGEGLNIDNVANKLENVDDAVVKKALDYLVNEEKKLNPSLTDAEAMTIARGRANEILDDAEKNIMLKGLTGSTNVASLSQRKDIAPELRALMGEYTDPMYNYYATIFKIASLTSSRQYLNSIKEYGMGKFLFEKTNKPERASTLVAAKGSETLAPLNGLYTFPEVYEAMQNQDKDQKLLIYEILGRIRKYKTVYNPATHVKNLIGNMGFAVSNGHWNYLPESYEYIKAEIAGGNNRKLDEVMDILRRENILNSSTGIGELKSYFSKHKNLNDFLGDVYAKGNTATALQKAKSFIAKIPRSLEKAYVIEDNIYKILAFVNESNRYSKVYYNKNFDQLTKAQKAEISEKVSNIVKDTYPTWTRVPKIVKTLSKGLFMGNFLSFPVESIRVSYNTLALALKEVKSKNPKLVRIGMTRFAGTLAYNSIFSSLVYYSMMAAKAGATGLLGYLRGDDEDETEKATAIRNNVVPWARNNDIYVLKFGENALEYLDIGSLDSYNYQKRVWNAFWGNINDKKGFDEAMAKSLGQILDPWLTTDFVISNYMKIMNNDDGRGNNIYNPEEPNALKSYWDMTKFISKQMAPGAIGTGFKIAEYYQKGELQKVKDELQSQVSARKYSTNLEKQFANFIYADYSDMDKNVGFKERLANAKKLYTKAKNSGLEGEDLEREYQDAIRVYKDILKTASKYYQYAIAGGANPDNLYTILSSSRIGSAEIGAIISQDYDYDEEEYIPRD